MKKLILTCCLVLACCCLNVNADEKTDIEIEACEALSNEKQICIINKNGECECTKITIRPHGVDWQPND